VCVRDLGKYGPEYGYMNSLMYATVLLTLVEIDVQLAMVNAVEEGSWSVEN
jgi:hypothetical protein